MISIQVTLTYVPATMSKNRLFNAGDKRKGLSAQAKAERESIVMLTRAAMRKKGAEFAPKVKTEIDILFSREDMNSDLHNVEELLFDALQDAIGVDDRYFSHRLRWYMTESRLSPKGTHLMDITISQADPE